MPRKCPAWAREQNCLLSDWLKCWGGPATLAEHLNDRRAEVKFKKIFEKEEGMFDHERQFSDHPPYRGKNPYLLSSATCISLGGEFGNLFNGCELESGKVASSNKFLTPDFRNPSILKTSVTHILTQDYQMSSLQDILGSLSSSKMLKFRRQRYQTNQTRQC